MAPHTDNRDNRKLPSPWLYVITLYFPFGLMSGGLGMQMPANLLKLLEYSNEQIGLISGIGLVASLRFIYAPWLDGATTKRRLSLVTLVLGSLMAIALAVITIMQLERDAYLWLVVGALFCIAFVNAAHETAADGYYIRALDPKRQAEFIGIKTASIRIGILSATTGLFLLATRIAEGYGAVGIESADKHGFHIGFGIAFAVAATVILLIAIYNKFAIPVIEEDQVVKHERFALLEVLRDYFRQQKVWLIVSFIMLYRFGEGFLVMKAPFYLDPLAEGGMASEAADMAYFSVLGELPWMTVGGILGGYIIKWLGLRRVFIPMALMMSLPNLLFFGMATTQPQIMVTFFGEDLNVAILVVSSIEAFFYGMSFSAMFYYMHIMATESGRNKTSVLAVSLALMNVGWYVPGALSGFVQGLVGYSGLFVASSTVGLVAIFLIPFLPMPEVERKNA